MYADCECDRYNVDNVVVFYQCCVVVGDNKARERKADARHTRHPALGFLVTTLTLGPITRLCSVIHTIQASN